MLATSATSLCCLHLLGPIECTNDSLNGLSQLTKLVLDSAITMFDTDSPVLSLPRLEILVCCEQTYTEAAFSLPSLRHLRCSQVPLDANAIGDLDVIWGHKPSNRPLHSLRSLYLQQADDLLAVVATYPQLSTLVVPHVTQMSLLQHWVRTSDSVSIHSVALSLYLCHF